jgi:hypothetical protein
MELRLVREQLDKCYRTEGVNHYENCKDLSDRYLTMFKDNKVRICDSISLLICECLLRIDQRL